MLVEPSMLTGFFEWFLDERAQIANIARFNPGQRISQFNHAGRCMSTGQCVLNSTDIFRNKQHIGPYSPDVSRNPQFFFTQMYKPGPIVQLMVDYDSRDPFIE